MQAEDCAVKSKPYHSNEEGHPCRLIFRLALYFGRLIILGKYLLASHALKLAGEKTEDHLNEIPNPDYHWQNSVFTNRLNMSRKIKYNCGYKEAATNEELHIVHYRSLRKV